jgi:short-subunit dehydrogenase
MFKNLNLRSSLASRGSVGRDRLSEKHVAVITGAGNGIGRELALQLASERKMKLAISDVDKAAVDETARTCLQRGATTVEAYALDVASREAVFRHASDVIDRFGRVDLVINNAGVALIASAREATWDDVHWVINVNLWGVMHGSLAFLPHLIKSGDGHLVNVSSIFGVVAAPHQSAYCAAKFGVRGFTDALRHEVNLEKHPVTVSTVHPGGIRTTMATRARFAPSLNREDLTQRFDKIASTEPDRAARMIVRGILRRDSRILIGNDAHAISALERVLGVGHGPVMRSIFSLLM